MNTKAFFMLITLSFCWGPSYLFIKFAGESFGPLTITAARVLIAAILLSAVCFFRGRRWRDYKHMWKHFLVMGIFINALPFTLINTGEQYISSGLAAILIATTPIFTALLAHFFVEKLNLRKSIGILIAFIGISLVYLPFVFDKVAYNATGILIVLLAAFSYAFSTVYAKKFLQGLPPLVGPAAQIVMASIIMVPLALIFERPAEMTTRSIGGILALGFIGTALAFFIFYELIRMKGPTYAALNALIAPLIAVFLGWIVMDETLAWNAYLGGALVILGLAICNPHVRIKK